MNALVPFGEMERMSQVLGKSKMFGKTAEDLLALMIIAQAEGKHPACAAQDYDIIQGKPAINSRSALARFQQAGGRIQWMTRTDIEAAAEFAHPAGGSLVVKWDMKRAAQAGLNTKDNWKKYPAQMLSARVIAEGVRAVYPACLNQMYTVEEVQDFDSKEPENKTIKQAEKTIKQEVEQKQEAVIIDPDFKKVHDEYAYKIKGIVQSWSLQEKQDMRLVDTAKKALQDRNSKITQVMYEKCCIAHTVHGTKHWAEAIDMLNKIADDDYASVYAMQQIATEPQPEIF